MKHKDETVAANVNGVAFLFKKNKIDAFTGEGSIAAPGKVVVKGEDGAEKLLETKAIVIATGSDVAQAARASRSTRRPSSPRPARLSLPKVPKKLIVVGAGVIGLELGSVWRRLGAEVTVVEFLDRILPGMDGEVAKQFQRMLEKQGFAFHLGPQGRPRSRRPGAGVKATIEPAAGGEAKMLEADVVLVAIGRRPYTRNLGLEAQSAWRWTAAWSWSTRISPPTCRASTPSATSIRGPMLAHKAEDEGVALAEILAGQAGHVNYDVIPGVVYTSPEIASVGKTEEELKADGRRLQGRQVPVHRQRPGARHAPHRGLREDPRRRRDRPGARRPYRRLRRRRDDRRSRAC